MKTILPCLIAFSAVFLLAFHQREVTPEARAAVEGVACDITSTSGYRCLFMGHSFFIPVAENMAGHAIQAGFNTHEQLEYFRGGNNGSPEKLWISPVWRPEIQGILDTAGIELLGMTFHGDFPSATGYLNWADYAIQQNPSTRFFVGMPWMRYPGTTTTADMLADYTFKHEQIVHGIIDTLRATFPNNEFYCIPYGAGAIELKDRFEQQALPDITALIGAPATSVYRDSLGHAGEIVKRLGELIFLRAMYGVDLQNYSTNTGYTTDLKAIAMDILAAHDSCYDCGGAAACSATHILAPQLTEVEVAVFPNPSAGKVQIRVDHPGPIDRPFTLNVYNAAGQRVYAAPHQAGETVILDELAVGIHTYSVLHNLYGRVTGTFLVH
ncbi:MAG: T9SS type A sorting domain-containing protein [Bacteroidota bacterium]